MVKDPVCGMEVDETKAPDTTHFMQRTYYFCAARCKADFERDPRKYVNEQGEMISHPSPPVTPEGDVFGRGESAETPAGLEQGGSRSMRPSVQAGIDQESKGGEWHGEGWVEEGHREAAAQGRPGPAKQRGPTLVKGQAGKNKPGKKFGT